MPQNQAIDRLGQVTFEDMQVGTADGGVGDADNRVSGMRDGRLGLVRPLLFAWATIDERFHEQTP